MIDRAHENLARPLALEIAANPHPVVFVDTCALLDVLRSAFRGDVPTAVLGAAVRVVQDYHAGNVSAWIVASTNVVLELEDNRSNVQSELEKGVRKLKAQLARMAKA